jgi:hypothetical protein
MHPAYAPARILRQIDRGNLITLRITATHANQTTKQCLFRDALLTLWCFIIATAVRSEDDGRTWDTDGWAGMWGHIAVAIMQSFAPFFARTHAN